LKLTPQDMIKSGSPSANTQR